MKKSIKIDNQPGFYFYPKDWMTDIGLQNCSLGARGLWIELLFLMFFSPKRGYLLLPNGEIPDNRQITFLIRAENENEIIEFLRELEKNKVLEKDQNGIIYNRKMVREGMIKKQKAMAGIIGMNTRWERKKNNKPITRGITEGITDPITGGYNKNITDIVKEIEKEKEIVLDKKKYLNFVFLKEEEYQKLVITVGQNKTDEMIERLNDYIGSKGAKYKSHYFTILVWLRKEGVKTIAKIIKDTFICGDCNKEKNNTEQSQAYNVCKDCFVKKGYKKRV